MSAARAIELRDAKRRRVLVTPEGLALPVTVAGMGTRFGALFLDLLLLYGSMLVLTLILVLTALQLFGMAENTPVFEFIAVLWIVAIFLIRQGYFMYFELGPRGATPGKRLTGIRIAARDGGRLTAEAVIARNLLRDVELFLPLVFIFGGMFQSGLAGVAGGLWFLVFALFPFFNRDRLRAGDLIAGTWVVEAPKRKLESAMSVGEAARGLSAATGAQYRFGDGELSVYGEFELQTLERVLRDGNSEALVAVASAICAKIGWDAGAGDERAFLEAFYSQLRARLESGMRFGTRKADKHS
jgi:uncharacterized RDD family membrane protein YckC